jgi:hypothetical protein
MKKWHKSQLQAWIDKRPVYGEAMFYAQKRHAARARWGSNPRGDAEAKVGIEPAYTALQVTAFPLVGGTGREPVTSAV